MTSELHTGMQISVKGINAVTKEEEEINPVLKRMLGVKSVAEYKHDLRVRRIQMAIVIPCCILTSTVFWVLKWPSIALLVLDALILVSVFLYLPKWIKNPGKSTR